MKEWNATLEALGQGKQSILIRNYKTNVSEFLLYPTVSYALKDNFKDSFQVKYQDFVENNTLPEKKGDNVLIKYFASIEKIVQKPVSKIPSDKYYIWTREHVKEYMKRQNLFIWILRVQRLKEPKWAEPTPGALVYSNVKDEISLEGMKPVLSDSEFNRIIQGIS